MGSGGYAQNRKSVEYPVVNTVQLDRSSYKVGQQTTTAIRQRHAIIYRSESHPYRLP